MALGITDAVSLSGRVLELVKQGVTLDLQERIMELREAVLNAQEEVLRLRAELSELRRTANDREQLTFDGSLYWRERSDGKEGPFCQRCFDVDAKLVRLQNIAGSTFGDWECAACDKSYCQQSGASESGTVKSHF
jgi:hypothetical protein